MASRKFKESWTPTPLLKPEEQRESRPAPPPQPRTLFRRTLVILRFFLSWFRRELTHYVATVFNRNAERSIEAARETREFAERMGGLWVILIRLASLRGDLLGKLFCEELARTRDRAAPISVQLIQRLVDQELKTLGSSFDEVFESIDPNPLSARSLAQFHRALLQNGREVVIRVRLPNAVERAATDLRWIRVLQFVMEQLDLEPHLRWDDLMFEVKKTTEDLLDFRSEVKELRKIRRLLRPRRIYVPEVFEKICTERLLVTEYIKGTSVADLQSVRLRDRDRCDAWLSRNKINQSRVWRRIFNAHHELLLEHDMFYTELLPSSILLLRDGRLAFVSLNTIGTMDADLQKNYHLFARCLSSSDYTKACDTYLSMGPALPYKDISDMRQSVLRALRKWESRTHVKNCPYREKSMASAMEAMARCSAAAELPAFWNLARLQLAERMLEPTLEFFGSTKNSLRALARYDRAAQLRSIKAATTQGVKKRMQRATDAARLQMQLFDNLQYDGEYLRRRLMSYQSKASGVAMVVGRLLMLLGRFAMVFLVVQLFLYIKQRFQVAVPITDQGGFGRIFGAVKIQNRSTWIVIILLLFYFRRFLQNLAKQLFSPEVRPSDVG